MDVRLGNDFLHPGGFAVRASYGLSSGFKTGGRYDLHLEFISAVGTLEIEYWHYCFSVVAINTGGVI